MNGSFWAGITVAETASQLALGGLLVAGYRQSNRLYGTGSKWLGPMWGTWAASAGSGCMAWACLTGHLPAPLVTLYGLSLAGFMLCFALTIGNVKSLMESLRFRAALLGLFGVLTIIFATFPLVCATDWGGVVLTAAGRICYIVWGALDLGLLALLGLGHELKGSEGHAWIFASVSSALLLLLDALQSGMGLRWTVPLSTHLGLPWALALGSVVLSDRAKNLINYVRLSAELAKSRDELTANSASLERAQRELGAKQQLAAVGELAAAIAHEVRNPLAIIVNAAAGLRRPTLEKEDRNTLLGILDEETARLNRLVTDLLRFARPVIVKRTQVSIAELAKRLQGNLPERSALEVDIPDEPSLRVVQADANLLRLVFDNVVANAFQAMPEGGTVRVVVSGAEIGGNSYVRISIVDHGHGMDDQVRSRATDPFYTTRPSGTGLGLPIVERILEAHGGAIEIDSALGHGTTVALLLPRLDPASTDASDDVQRA